MLLGFELWVGDPAQIRARRVRKQRNDRLDAEPIRKLVMEDRFPRIWMPSPENRDIRQLLLHRHRLVLHANTSHESVAGYRHERRAAREEGTVE
jgi:transposase